MLGYLLGSIPFGYLLVRATGGGDIRFIGSGNIGATNVARAAGWAVGVATLLLDAAKGYFAVWLAAHFSGGNIRFMMYAGLAAILGHVFPVWLKFEGGKGVATALGVFLAICWPARRRWRFCFLLVVLFWRYVSLASISAAASLPLLVYLLYAPGHAPPDGGYRQHSAGGGDGHREASRQYRAAAWPAPSRDSKWARKKS